MGSGAPALFSADAQPYIKQRSGQGISSVGVPAPLEQSIVKGLQRKKTRKIATLLTGGKRRRGTTKRTRKTTKRTRKTTKVKQPAFKLVAIKKRKAPTKKRSSKKTSGARKYGGRRRK